MEPYYTQQRYLRPWTAPPGLPTSLGHHTSLMYRWGAEKRAHHHYYTSTKHRSSPRSCSSFEAGAGSPVRVVPRPGLIRDSTVLHEPGRGAKPRGCKCVQLTSVHAGLHKLALDARVRHLHLHVRAAVVECKIATEQGATALPRAAQSPSMLRRAQPSPQQPHSAPAEAWSTGCHLRVTPCAIRRPPVRSVSALNCLAGFFHGSGASPITRSKRSMSAATPAVGSSRSKCGGEPSTIRRLPPAPRPATPRPRPAPRSAALSGARSTARSCCAPRASTGSASARGACR